MTIEQKIDILYKKLIYNRGTSSINTNKPYFIEPKSNIYINPTNVLIDLDDIKTTPPTTYNNGDMFDKDGNLTTDSNIAIIQYFEEDALRYTSEYNVYKLPFDKLIPTTIADGKYNLTLYNGASEIYITNDVYVDYDSGIILFYDTEFTSIENILVKGWKYIGKNLSEQKNIDINEKFISLHTDGVLANGLSWDGATKTFTYQHNFNTFDYFIEIRNGATNEIIQTDIIKNQHNVKIHFSWDLTIYDTIYLQLRQYKFS